MAVMMKVGGGLGFESGGLWQCCCCFFFFFFQVLGLASSLGSWHKTALVFLCVSVLMK